MKIDTNTAQNTTDTPIAGMQCYQQPFLKFYFADSMEKMKQIESESINCILTDPPYKYLKNQKLEVDFNETTFFCEAKRILKQDGFIILFGRGTSFYRWNSMLDELGFKFNEEIIWDKSYMTSPVTPISRKHETISIHTKKNGTINNVRIPYTEMKNDDFISIAQDLKRIKSALNNPKALEDLNLYIETKKILYKDDKERGYNTTVQGIIQEQDRAVKTLQSIDNGMKEKSIILVKRDHYKTIHPTQKPVRLIERLLALTTKKGDIVVDPFAGSCSTGEACLNTGRKFIGYEIDLEFYEKAVERLKSVEPRLF